MKARKRWALFCAGSVLVVGFLSALAVVPHTHGGDATHSMHKTCPLYQLSLHSLDLADGPDDGIVIFFILSFVRVLGVTFVQPLLFLAAFLRAPASSARLA